MRSIFIHAFGHDGDDGHRPPTTISTSRKRLASISTVLS
jgi:hypothetical protein